METLEVRSELRPMWHLKTSSEVELMETHMLHIPLHRHQMLKTSSEVELMETKPDTPDYCQSSKLLRKLN